MRRGNPTPIRSSNFDVWDRSDNLTAAVPSIGIDTAIDFVKLSEIDVLSEVFTHCPHVASSPSICDGSTREDVGPFVFDSVKSFLFAPYSLSHRIFSRQLLGVWTSQGRHADKPAVRMEVSQPIRCLSIIQSLRFNFKREHPLQGGADGSKRIGNIFSKVESRRIQVISYLRRSHHSSLCASNTILTARDIPKE